MNRFLYCTLAILGLAVVAAGQSSAQTRYLAFQIFTGESDPKIAIGDSGMHPLGPLPPQNEIDAFVDDIIRRIGSVGDRHHRLAVIFGLLAFDNSDTDVRRFIAKSFDRALQKNVAVGFHIDDSMFWARRTDLWGNPANVEWLDWNGTRSTGRRIEWGPQPKEIPPQMCFNSKAIQAEVRRRATEVIGKAIKAGVDQLKQHGRGDLFAGVIVGSETQIGQDFGTGRYLGYHALSNLGYGRNHPPRDIDSEREKVVQSFITLWCKGFVDAGISPDNLYSHTAFLSRRIFEQQPTHPVSYSEFNHFAPPSVAFGPYRRPGFSTYPQPGLFDQIYSELARHAQVGWASSEGTNLQLGSAPGESGMNIETYLAKMFNHGAIVTNIYSWGIGGDANKHMDFRVVTEGEEAIRAYHKFLQGDPLLEATSTGSSYLERLPAKIHRIQSELPAWIQKTGSQAQVEPMMQSLEAALKANDFVVAEKVADEILKLLDH